MADLITRLLLNTQQFDNNLGKSTKQIQGFQQKIQGFSSGAVSAFTKFAGVLGVAYGATELLQKGLNSNATLQDKYNSLMQAGSTVTDQFFTAIYSGDWTVFNDGIEKAIKNAKEYADTYRNVQRMLETTSIKFEQTDARKTQLEAIIEDDTKPLEERKKAQQELDRILLMGVADIREASQITERELNNMLADLIGEAQYITTENAQKLILDIRNKYSELRKELDACVENEDELNSRLTVSANGWFDLGLVNDDIYSGVLTIQSDCTDKIRTYSLVYNVKTGQKIDFGDQFTEGFNIKFFFSQYLKEKIKKIPEFKTPIFKNHLKPESFRNLYVSDQGIVFATDFNTILGSQRIILPFTDLKGVIKRKSPLKKMVND